jgi:hypothetical protein
MGGLNQAPVDMAAVQALAARRAPVAAVRPPKRGGGQKGRKVARNKQQRPAHAAAVPRAAVGRKRRGVSRRVGSKYRVFHGTADVTPGGLTRNELMYNRNGKVVSKKAHAHAIAMIQRAVANNEYHPVLGVAGL